MDKIVTKPLTKAQVTDIIKTFIPAKMNVNSSIKKERLELPNHDNELFQLDQFPLFDKELAIKNCGNESILLELLILMITKQIPDDLTRINMAFEKKDFPLVERIAHKIKSGAMYLGTTRMKFACQYVERYWKSGERELFNQLYSQAVQVMEDTSRYISDWLNLNKKLS